MYNVWSQKYIHLQAFLTGSPVVSLSALIKKRELAPSKVHSNDILTVSKIILDHIFKPSWESPKDLLGTLPEIVVDAEPLANTHDKPLKELKALLDYHTSTTLHLFNEEAASYTTLGNLCVHFASALHREFRSTYKYCNQFKVTTNAKQGPPPRSDSCVVLVDSKSIPRFLYECKISLQHTIMQLNDKHLIEVLLQGYYCLQHYEVERMLICLTDLVEWHYFLIEESNEKMKITHHKLIYMAMVDGVFSETGLLEHTNFVIKMERLMRNS